MSNSIIRSNENAENIPTEIWLMTSEERKQYFRLQYILSIKSHIPNRCPKCKTILEVDDEQIYCPNCGLVTHDSITYTAGIKHHLPHGLRLG